MMSALADWVLANLALYGFPILVLVSYVGSLGIPFPITLVVVAAGAFTRQGFLDWRLAALGCLMGAALADNSEYLVGHLAQAWLKRHFGHQQAWQQAMETLRRQGGWAILLTRFWLTPLAPAVNVISGSRLSYGRFLGFDLLGELLWVLAYGGLGYLFADRWQAVSQAVSGFSGLSFAVAMLAGAIYLLARASQPSQRRAISHGWAAIKALLKRLYKN